MSETDYSFEPEANDVLIEVDELVENPDIDIGEYDSSEEDSVTGSLGGLQFDVIDSDSPTVYTTIDDVTPADYTCGTPGELPTPSTALVDADLPLNKIITVVTTNVEQIVEVNEDLIQFISDNNARVYAVLNDGTRVQCELSDVFDPDKAHAQVFVNQGLIIANALKQHFWYDSNGAHVTDDEQDDWNEEYSKTGHGDLANPSLNRPWHNILINSYGLLIRKGLIWLSQHSVGSVMFYDGTGNTLNNVVAGFSTDGVQIGKLTEKHLIIDDDGFTAYDENGDIAPITAYLSGSLIEDSTITGSKIASSTISGSNMIDGTITGSKIASSTIENSNIKDGTITGGKIIGSTLTDIPQAAIVNLSTDYAHVTNGIIDRATIDHANVNGLSATYATVVNLNAATGRISTLETNTADIATLRANSAKVANLTAQQLEAANAYIASLTAGNVTANDIIADTGKIHNLTAQQLSAAVGYIADLTSASITTTDLIADHGTIGSLDTHYAQINMANVNNAWITNGTVKDGAITNAMINSVSANKLTAGTIDASNITVTNLNADNITAGTINGQRIGTGSLSLDKLSDDVYTESEVDSLLATMQSEIDGAIETWTGTTIPTLTNAPASSWTSNSDKDKHVGDVYFVVNSQSQQNGYNYRFTKSGTGSSATYSWQLIKDTDITNALSRLSTAEGSITQFSSDISQLQTSTGTLTTKTTQLETSLGDKVDVTDFNDLEDTVDGHTQTLSQHTTAISSKADSSTVTSVTNRVSKNEQDISGINTTISSLTTTVNSKADSSTVTTISNQLNTVSNTVDGHTQTISSVQTTLNSKADSDDLDDVADRVSTAESTISQHTTDISLKANSADTYTKTQTDGLISTEVTDRNAAITAATNAITLSVSQTYATKTYVDDGLEDANDYTDTEVASAKAAIKVTTDGISTEVAKKTDKTAIISTINQTAETVKIAASKVDITGEAVFSAINNDTGTTKINGGKIDATSITLGYSQITNTPSIPTKTSDLTNDSSYATTTQAQGYADAKDTAIAAAAKRTYVSIRATAVDYSANTATLEATLYIDGTATTTGVTYVWLMDGTVISGETSRTYSVPASNGLNHAYSCKCTTTV